MSKIELRPRITLKVLLQESWWFIVVIGILGSVLFSKAPSEKEFFWFLGGIGLLLVAFCLSLIYTLTGYLQIEEGILERRWSWKRARPSERVILKDMESCTIERYAITVGNRGLRDYYGYTFEPKKFDVFADKIRIDMPVGLKGTPAESAFLQAIKAEMRK